MTNSKVTPTADRCGTCTFCCQAPIIPELKKPLGVMCQHCDGQRCKIYDHRPASCQNFWCVWAQKEGLDPNLRPDRCGVMFEKLRGANIYLAIVSPDTPDAWQQNNLVLDGIHGLLRNGAIVIIVIGPNTKKHLLLPEGKTIKEALAELNSIRPRYNLEV